MMKSIKNLTDQKIAETDQIINELSSQAPAESIQDSKIAASLKKALQPPEITKKKKSVNYILTINNPKYTCEELDMRLRMHDKLKAYAFQLEKGEEKGTPHI